MESDDSENPARCCCCAGYQDRRSFGAHESNCPQGCNAEFLVAAPLAHKGGPNLLGGTNVVIGAKSFVANAISSGNTYSYRVDTVEALGWITETVAERGGQL